MPGDKKEVLDNLPIPCLGFLNLSSSLLYVAAAVGSITGAIGVVHESLHPYIPMNTWKQIHPYDIFISFILYSLLFVCIVLIFLEDRRLREQVLSPFTFRY